MMAALSLPFEGSRVVVFFVVILLAQAVAIVLFRFSKQSSRQPEKGSVEGNNPLEALRAPQPLLPAILEETKQLGVPARTQKRIASAFSKLFNKQLETKTRALTQELTHKYEQVVQEKSQEITVLRQQNEERTYQTKQTEAVLRSVADGVVVVNQKGEVMFMNPAAERLFGVESKERLGRPLTEGLTDEQLLSLVKKSLADGEQEIEFNAKQDQTKRIVRSSNAVVQDESGKAVGMVSILTDVTKQRELDRLRSEFASAVTHELRTPIVAVQHSLSLLSDGTGGQLSESQKKFISIADRNLSRLRILIDDLLDFAKLEARKMVLKPERCSLQSVINEACKTLDAWARSKEIRIEQKIADSLPETDLDPARVTQVLNNLMGNAIKFTPKGGTVTVQAHLPNGNKEIHVTVADTGPGIAKEDIPKLFKKFQQVGRGDASSVSGTGLGLAIAKEIVELHGGSIWAESEKGQGARFTFSLSLTSEAP